MGKLDMLRGTAFGLGMMYYFDPDRGKRRRALVADQIVHLANSLGHNIDVMIRDATHRCQGMIAETGAMLMPEEVSEQQLAERVRAKLGRCVSHPSSIEVTVAGESVILSGPVLAEEVDELLNAIRSVRGVGNVENRLEVHEDAGDVPGLQGPGRKPGQRAGMMQESWPPATRLLASVIGGGMVLRAVRNPGLLNLGLGAVGFGLLTRAATNMETKRLAGMTERRGIDLQKTINIQTPLEQVYKLFSHPENFPRFMKNVREVVALGDGRWRWTVAGPMGAPVRFVAACTQQVPHETVAWRSEPESAIGHAGIVRFQRNTDGGTRVEIRMTYSPPAGAAGHLVASLFGSDPKSEMDEDLLRMKTFLETGKEPHDAAAHAST